MNTEIATYKWKITFIVRVSLDENLLPICGKPLTFWVPSGQEKILDSLLFQTIFTSQECWRVRFGQALCAYQEHRIEENRHVIAQIEFSLQTKERKGGKLRFTEWLLYPKYWKVLYLCYLILMTNWVHYVVFHSCKKSQNIYMWFQSLYSFYFKPRT